MEKEPGKFCLSAVSQIYFKLVQNLIKVILNVAAVQNPKSHTEALISIAPHTV